MLAPSRSIDHVLRALAALLIAALPIAAAADRGDALAAERALLERAQSEIPQPLWIRDGRLSGQARDLLAVLRRVEDFGFSAEDFSDLMPSVEAAADPLDAARFEPAMSLAALRLMHYLHDGRVDPQAAGYELGRGPAPIDRITMLRYMAASADVNATLGALEPRSSQYHALKQWLARYRAIPGFFAPLPAPGVHSIRSGDHYAGAGELRRRLVELGDAENPAEGPAVPAGSYDATLADAVARFQRRHGLQSDGVLGPRTLAALAVPISRRIRQIELTLERWRWLPDIRPPAVIVNVPQYMLYTLPDPAGGEAMSLRKIPVIVGKLERQTPLFDSAIEAVIIRPYWEVPRSIVLDELLPLIERDAQYLARHDMEIVRGSGDEVRVLPADAAAIAALRAGHARLRQRPGPRNALGLVKFVLPGNRHEVYLHSTPEVRLFARDRRALSHGCIRVSDATALAAYLLKHTPGDWSVDAIEAATCGESTFTIRLSAPVPLFILYGTVVIDGGEVLFFDDIYGYDRRLEALLAHAGG